MTRLITDLPQLAIGGTWDAFKERWQQWISSENPNSGFAEEMLHGIFEARTPKSSWSQSCAEEQERLLFLFELANGHSTSKRTSDCHVRDKAFKVLAANFFRNIHDSRYAQLSSEVRDKLIWFFLDEGNSADFSACKNVLWECGENAPHAKKLASEYMRGFCKYFWEYRYTSDEVRCKLLELLYYHDAVSTIMPHQSYSHRQHPGDHHHDWNRFNAVLLKKLEELALRDAETIELGVLHGSNTAWTYVLVSMGLQEIDRQAEIKRLREERTRIDQELERI